MRSRRRLILVSGSLLFLGLLSACVTVTAPPVVESGVDVHFISSPSNYCGLVALQMAMVYAAPERVASFSDIYDDVYMPALNGTTMDLIEDCALQHGYRTDRYDSDTGKGLMTLSNELPIIVFLANTTNINSVGHFVLVTAFSKNPPAYRMHTGMQSNLWYEAAYVEDRFERGCNQAMWLSF
ncbi:MAG: hypothetical protein EOL87_08860 [Spartobacteria bacterium]|nr:hypothetical protein [Spartobacteria bacterium]